MSHSFIATSKHSSGALQRFIFSAENTAAAKKKLETPEGVQEAQSEQHKKQMGKKRDFSSLSRRLRPSHTEWRHSHLLGKIFNLFEEIIDLLERLWPGRPSQIDYRLFHNLTSSNENLRSALSRETDTKTRFSKVLSSTIDFLKNEKKREKIPNSLIQELSLCKKWAEKLESAEQSTNPNKQTKLTKEIAADITTHLKKAKPKTSFLIPGGWIGKEPNEDRHALYRVTKESNGKFTLTIISRSKEIQHNASLSAGGKEKILPSHTFHSITLEELSQAPWWEQLLDLQVIKQEGDIQTGPTSLQKLFHRFTDRLTPPSSADPKSFVTAKEQSTYGQNLWQVVDVVAFPNERKSERRQRLHLHRDLTLFSHFFRDNYRELKTNATCRILLQEGMRNLSRKASLLHERDMIDEKEITFLQKELQAVEKALKKANEGDVRKDKWSKSSFKPFAHRFSYSKQKLQAISPSQVSAFTGSAKTNGADLSPLPNSLPTIALPTRQPIDLSQCTPAESVKRIATFLPECETLLHEQKYSLVKDRIEEIVTTLPFSTDVSAYQSLSSEDTLSVCESITKLSTLLVDACKQSQATLPHHFLFLTTLALIQQQIALTHPVESNLAPEFQCNYLKKLTDALKSRNSLNSLVNSSDNNPRHAQLKKTIEACHKQRSDNYSRWASSNSRPPEIESLRRNDVIGLEKKQSKPLLKHLVQQIDTIDSFIPIKQQPSFYIQKGKKRICVHDNTTYYATHIYHAALRPTLHAAFRAAVVKGDVSEGSYSNRSGNAPVENNKKKKEKFSIHAGMTPEAIADNPLYIMGELKKTCKLSLPLEKEGPLLFSKEDMRDILFLLTEKMSLRQMMGLIQSKPYLLDHPDVRFFCYHAPFDRTSSEYDSKQGKSIQFSLFSRECEWDPSLLQQFPQWLEKQIALNLGQNHTERALFLIELHHRWIRECRQQKNPEIQQAAGKAIDYLPQLQNLAQQSLLPNHSLAPHKNAIWQELLHHYIDKKNFTVVDIECITLARFVLRGTSSNPYNTTPQREEEIQRVLDTWREPIQQQVASSSDLRHTLLEKTAWSLGITLPKEGTWVAEGHSYRIGDYSFDLGQGIFICHEDGTTNQSFSPAILRDQEVAEAFSTQSIPSITSQAKSEKDAMHYFFSDTAGNPSRIVESHGTRKIYKELTIGTQKKMLQYVPRKSILPETISRENLSNTDGPKIFFKTLWKFIQQCFQPPFPVFLRNADYRFWVDPSKPNNLFVYDKKGSPIFQLQFSRRLGYRVLDKCADLRNGTKEVVLKKFGTLADSSSSFWKSFSQFDDPGNILFWKDKKGNIERMELLRFGLVFEKQQKNLVCMHPDYAGWIAREEDASALSSKGMPGALILTHPKHHGKKKVIFPEHTIQIGLEKDQVPGFKQALKLLFSMIRRILPSIPIKDPLGLFRFDLTASHLSFFSFDLDPHTLVWNHSSPQAGKAFLHLTTIACHHYNWDAAFNFFHQAKPLISHAFSKEVEEACLALIEHPIHSPESTALQLQVALVMAQNGDPSTEIQENLSLLYKKYMEWGHKIPYRFRLTQEQESQALSAVVSTEPNWVLAHLPAYSVSSTPHPVQATKISQKKWTKTVPASATKGADVANAVLQQLQQQKREEHEYDEKKKDTGIEGRLQRLVGLKDPRQLAFVERQESMLALQFDKLYHIARSASCQDEEFVRMEAFLQSMGKEEELSKKKEENIDKKKSSSSITPILKNYLLHVMDLRQQGISSSAFPSLEIHFTQAETEGSCRSNNFVNQEKKLETFFKDLDALLVRHQPPQKEKSPEEIQKKKEEKLEHAMQQIHLLLPRLQEFLGTHFTTFLNAASDTFEIQLDGTPKEALPLPEIQPSGGALFKTDEIENRFRSESAFVESIHRVPDLSSLDNEKEPAIQAEKTKTIEEVGIALDKKKTETLHIIKSEEERKACLEKVTKKREEVVKKADVKKKELLELFQLHGSSAQKLEKMAGFMPSTEVADILRACLQSDWKALEKSLPPGKSQEDVLEMVFAYIDAASQEIRCDKALAFLKEMEPDMGGIQTSPSETLYQILTAERQFDPRKHLHLAAFEMYLGFTLRPNQIQTVVEMVNNPRKIKQAATGAGKTTVINFLKGIMSADGKKLVTMVFPKDLYQENLTHIKENLGKLYERNTYRLEFSEETSLTKGNRSTFQTIYSRLAETIANKGVVATTRESLQALEKNLIKQIYFFSLTADQGKSEEELKIQKMHLVYAAKILELLYDRSIFNVDEFDALLSPKQRQDLALSIGMVLQYPPFYRQEALRIYQKLSYIQELGLKTNTQSDRFAQEGQKALESVGQELIKEWKQEKIDHTFLYGYLFSTLDETEEQAFINYLDANATPEQKDRLALTKDLLTTFVPLALQKKEDGKYKRSANGSDTVNCSSPGKPREGSKPKEILETMAYTIQDYLYKGISPIKIQQIVDDYYRQAEQELNPLGGDLHEEPGDYQAIPTSFDATHAAQQFIAQFPTGNSLSSLKDNPAGIAQLTAWVNNNEAKRWELLEEQLAKITDCNAKISCTSANFVSMGGLVGGASATTGNPFAYPSKIDNENVTDPGTVGEMLLNLQKKVNGKPVEKYPAENPLPTLLQLVKEKGVHSIVDGGVSLTGLEAQKVAEHLIDSLPPASHFRGVAFFDKTNNIRIMTRDKKVWKPEMANVARHELNTVLLGAHARGADVQVGSSNRFVVTDTNSLPLEEKLQNAGRSRDQGHTITFASPQEDGMHTLDDVIATGVRSGALEGADNLVRAKQQELEDTVRNNMLRNLVAIAASMNPGSDDQLPVNEQIVLQEKLAAVLNDDSLSPDEKKKQKESLANEEQIRIATLKQENAQKAYQLKNLFDEYQGDSSQQFLVQVGAKEFETDGSYQPGKYFAVHGGITRKNQDPKEVFQKRVDELLSIAQTHQLQEAQTELSHWKALFRAHTMFSDPLKQEDTDLLNTPPSEMEQLQSVLQLDSKEKALHTLRRFTAMLEQMPTKIAGKGAPETETSVDLDTETDTATEVNVNASEDTKQDQPYYLPWQNQYSEHFATHSMPKNTYSGYSSSFETTENEHPLSRTSWANPIFHRKPHDLSQMPFYYVECQFDPTNGDCKRILGMDPLDVPNKTHRGRISEDKPNWSIIYDMRTNQILLTQEPDVRWRAFSLKKNAIPRDLLQQLPQAIAQVRFEDGQCNKSTYTQGQWEALEKWLLKQPLKEVEEYFVGEVLKNRPEDRRKYQGSDLKKLFSLVKKKKANLS